MKEYETIFVTRPDVDESQTSQLLDRVNKLIERHNGTVLEQKNWGKKDLAYRVGKYTQGIYHYYDYAADGGVVNDLEHALRLHDLPMKYLTVQLSDDVDVKARKKEIDSRKDDVVAPQIEPVKEAEEVQDDGKI